MPTSPARRVEAPLVSSRVVVRKRIVLIRLRRRAHDKGGRPIAQESSNMMSEVLRQPREKGDEHHERREGTRVARPNLPLQRTPHRDGGHDEEQTETREIPCDAE